MQLLSYLLASVSLSGGSDPRVACGTKVGALRSNTLGDNRWIASHLRFLKFIPSDTLFGIAYHHRLALITPSPCLMLDKFARDPRQMYLLVGPTRQPYELLNPPSCARHKPVVPRCWCVDVFDVFDVLHSPCRLILVLGPHLGTNFDSSEGNILKHGICGNPSIPFRT